MDAGAFFRGLLERGKGIVASLPVSTPAPATPLGEFRSHWRDFQEHLSHQQMTGVEGGGSTFPAGALDARNPLQRAMQGMLAALEGEEAGGAEGQGGVLAYALEHHVLEQVCTAGKSDLPAGMAALALHAVARVAAGTAHPLLLHPVSRHSVAAVVEAASPPLPPVAGDASPTAVLAARAAAAPSTAAAPPPPPPPTSPRAVRLAAAQATQLLRLLAALWARVARAPASLEAMAAEGGVMLWLRGVLCALPRGGDLAATASDVLLSVLALPEAALTTALEAHAGVVAACIVGAAASAWESALLDRAAFDATPPDRWGALAELPAVCTLDTALRAAAAALEVAQRHPALAVALGDMLRDALLLQRVAAALEAPADEPTRAWQCVLLQHVLAALGGVAATAPGGAAAAALAALLRRLLTGQALVNLAAGVAATAPALGTAAAQAVTAVLTAAPELLPEAGSAAALEVPPSLAALAPHDAAGALTAALVAAQGELWELTQQSSAGQGVQGVAAAAAIRDALLAEDAAAEAGAKAAGDPPPGALTAHDLSVVGVKLHIAIAKALSGWAAPGRAPAANIALSGLLPPALQWHVTRTFLLGAKRKEGVDAPPSTLQVALAYAWRKTLAALRQVAASMGSTPFRAGLLTLKLRLGASGAADGGAAGEVATLAAAALDGDVDPALDVVLATSTPALTSALVLDALSSEVAGTLAHCLPP